MKDILVKRYRNSAEEFAILEAKEDKILLYLSVARFFSFLGGAVLIWFIYIISSIAAYILITVIIILFFWLLKLYSDHTRKKRISRQSFQDKH